jgi:hypothetical protein
LEESTALLQRRIIVVHRMASRSTALRLLPCHRFAVDGALHKNPDFSTVFCATGDSAQKVSVYI